MARRLKTQARTAARRRKAWPALDFARPAPVVGFDPAAGPDQTRPGDGVDRLPRWPAGLPVGGAVMARRKLPKHPTAAALRVGHTVYLAHVVHEQMRPVTAVCAYPVVSGPDRRVDGEVLPEVLTLGTARRILQWCERYAMPRRLFWTRRQAQRCAEQVLRDYLRAGW